jgi:HlyD family secretion protein
MMKNNIQCSIAPVCLVLAVSLFASCDAKVSSVNYEFTSVRVSTLERTVSSSGTIHPVATVKILPQMSGKVEKVYVDYNDPVRRGDLIAELNTDVLKIKRDQLNASYLSARATYELKLINYNNQEALALKNLISEYDLRASRNDLDNSAAALALAESNLKTVDTEINQYAYITSPIDGIVLDRNINAGDTVIDSSSNNSTSMFTLAENLREMRIEAGVGELDVSSIHKGQSVRFTLESLQGRSFTGTVENLRMVPVVQGGVVSYTVIISAENYDGSLLPGMTCAVDFIVERSENVLAISNAALRYQPTTLNQERIDEMVFLAGLVEMDDTQQQAAIASRTQAANAQAQQNANRQNQNTGIAGLLSGGGNRGAFGGGPGGLGGPGGQGQQQTQTSRTAVVMRNLWYVTSDGKLEVMRVQTGISNGTLTEIFTMEDLDGKQFILRERI